MNATESPRYMNRVGYTDIFPFEVVRVVSDRCMVVRPMEATADPTWTPEIAVGGFVGYCANQSSQRWIIKANADAEEVRIRLHHDGKWRDANGATYCPDAEPRRYHDYNF